jgi:thioredoxin reductase (NADPH)
MKNGDVNSGSDEGRLYDCIIIGAGPGGLQAAIYLGRYMRKVLLVDRGGGRTRHAKLIENFLAHKAIPGSEIIDRGMEQARSFGVEVEKGLVTSVKKKESFEVSTASRTYRSKFVIVSSGVYDHFPPIENLHAFLGKGFYTCVDCDGYKTKEKKLLVIGNSINSVRLAFAMKEMYTKDITLNLLLYEPPGDYTEELENQGIRLIKGTPVRVVGNETVEGVVFKDGSQVSCEVIMSNFGYRLNDEFLSGLELKRDAEAFKYVTDHHYESSMKGLYIVGPLNTGHDQVVIAAGEGAVAAIDIKSRLLEM